MILILHLCGGLLEEARVQKYVSTGAMQQEEEEKNIRDEVVPVLVLLETAKGHLGAGDVLLGVLEVVKQRRLVPGDALLLVRVRVGEAVDRARLAPKQAVQRRPDLVAAARLERVALCAPRLEQVRALFGVSCFGGSVFG